MSGDSEKSLNRRAFLGAMLVAGTAPLMVPARVLGGDAAPSNLLRIGCIGVGRMGIGNMQEAMGQGLHAGARVVAVCDVDRHRVQEAKNRAEARYREILGMLTGWGSHMYDIAQWGIGTDLDSGPVEIKAEGDYPDRGLFDVHTRYSGEAVYANGVRMTSRSDRQAGVRFIGEDGWIWVQRGNFEAHDREVLRERPEGGIELRTSNNHMRDFIECLRSGDDPVATVEAGHRTNTVCWLHHIAMKLGRTVKWDPQAEAFDNDPEADRFLDYERRAGYEIV